MTLDIIIPTLNSASVLEDCLTSVSLQHTRHRINILIIDGGSTDSTLSVARKFHATVITNPLKTAEAGKAIGIRQSKSDFIALIDSDNILPDSGWIDTMLHPFQSHPDLIGTEPDSFTYRPHAGFIERYCSLIGANDPYAFVAAVADRKNYINHSWHWLPLSVDTFLSYDLVHLHPGTALPTFGANGTIYRTEFLKKHLHYDYLFDIDLISEALVGKEIIFAKVHTGIIHVYCGSDIGKFIRKQTRRLTDYYCYRKLRHYNWSVTNRLNIFKFTLYTWLLFPALIDSFRGFINRPDPAWFFHLPACILSFSVYTAVSLKKIFGLLKPVNREVWSQ